MAKLVTLHDSDGEVIYPQSVWDENMIPDNTIKSSMIDWSSIVMKGTWKTTQALSSVGTSTQTTIDISQLGFSTANDYVVTVTNRITSQNSWATTLSITDRTASSFTIKLFNSHWSGGAVSAGDIIDWAVFKVA